MHLLLMYLMCRDLFTYIYVLIMQCKHRIMLCLPLSVVVNANIELFLRSCNYRWVLLLYENKDIE